MPLTVCLLLSFCISDTLWVTRLDQDLSKGWKRLDWSSWSAVKQGWSDQLSHPGQWACSAADWEPRPVCCALQHPVRLCDPATSSRSHARRPCYHDDRHRGDHCGDSRREDHRGHRGHWLARRSDDAASVAPERRSSSAGGPSVSWSSCWRCFSSVNTITAVWEKTCALLLVL